MATFDTSDDDQQLEAIRARLLGANPREEPSPAPPVTASPAAAVAAVAIPESVPADATAVDESRVDAAPFTSTPGSATPPAPAVDPAMPRPSFAGVRPRSATVRPSASPVVAAPVDATPGDIDVEVPEPAHIAVPETAGPTADQLEELSKLLGGVSVEQLQALARNPQLLDGAVVDTATAPGAVDAPAADSVVEDVPAEADGALARADLATQGWRSWLVKLGIPVRKGAAERFTDLMDSVHTVIRRDLGRPVVIGVTSHRGSCGKTSTAVLMGRLLAEIRGEHIVALDTDLYGTLLTRAVGEESDQRTQGKTMSSMASQLHAGGGDITKMVRDGGDGFVFVPGSHNFRANTVTVDEYRTILEAVRQVYSIVLVDMSALNDTALCAAVLESLDGLVMMSPTIEDGVGYLYRTQAELQNRGVDRLNGHRITALNNLASIRSQLDTAEFARGLKHRDKRDVVEIPYDRHLAQSKTIDITQLSESAKTAFTITLAALIDTFAARK